jgi:Ca2+-binding RTX toxin-like protein
MVAGARLNRGTIEVVGTPLRDSLRLSMSGSTIVVSGTLNNTSMSQRFSSASVQRILAFLGDGNDSLTIDSTVRKALLVNAGAGNDTVKAGGGVSVLIGGLGPDQLSGGAKSDLLISGTTVYDDNTAALTAILGEWSASRTLAARSQNIQTGKGSFLQGTGIHLTLNETMFNDSDVDTLMGGADLDWFLVNPKQDKLKDKSAVDRLN